MKKILSIIPVLLITYMAHAQSGGMYIDYKLLHILATLSVMVLVTVLILSVLKLLLEYRLKNKIVEKGVSEQIASSILRTTGADDKQIHFKWFALLAGVGAGLTIVYYTQPLGIHSLAIMSFSVALSFLGYYFFIRRSGK